MRAARWAALVLALVLAAGCANVKKAINNAAATTFTYVYTVDPQHVALPGFCAPAPTVQQLASQVGDWETIKDHVTSVEVSRLDYQITQNATPTGGKVDLYVADSNLTDLIPSLTPVAETQTIDAGTTYPYQPVNWLGDGLDRVNGFVKDYLDDSGTRYFVCGLFDPLTAGPDLTVGVKVTLKVIAVPLG